MAWNSFNKPAKIFRWLWSGMMQQDMKNKEVRIHPTQKPISLYQWLLTQYAKEGDNILDTHLGSGSIAIAVDSVNKIEKMNLTLTACELDKEYFDNAIRRIEEKTKWNSLF
jgi:site-specific DNA-methyltransferase (adenine-specific)